jgi:hypothetical protein
MIARASLQPAFAVLLAYPERPNARPKTLVDKPDKPPVPRARAPMIARASLQPAFAVLLAYPERPNIAQKEG